MSKIIATHNLDSKTWIVESTLSESHCDLEFRFIKNGTELLEIQDLTVGYELYQDGIDFKIQGGQHPYISLHYAVSRAIALTLGHNVGYKLNLWVIDNNITDTTEYTFVTPPQPSGDQ